MSQGDQNRYLVKENNGWRRELRGSKMGARKSRHYQLKLSLPHVGGLT